MEATLPGEGKRKTNRFYPYDLRGKSSQVGFLGVETAYGGALKFIVVVIVVTGLAWPMFLH